MTASAIPVAKGQEPQDIVELPPRDQEVLEPTDDESTPDASNRREVEQLFLYRRSLFLDAAQDRTVKNKPGVVRRIIVGNAPAGMNGVLTLRDGATGAGKVIARVTPVAGQPFSMVLDLPFEKSLNIVLAGATPGEWTVVWE